MSDSNLQDTILDCLTQQVSEFELLKSMYPENNEIMLSSPESFKDIERFINGETTYTPLHLDFVVNVSIDKMKLEICVTLPSFYPTEEPDVYIRCNQLNRQQESALNNQLSIFIKKNHCGELCLFTIVTWVQDHIYTLIEEEIVNQPKQSTEKASKEVEEERFVRFWIYSHHIYNKKKREEIVSKSKDYSITGFCLPGKPGIICLEGDESNCKEWWREIKSMCWKKIVIRKTEIFDMKRKNKVQKFDKFEELHFQNASSKNSKHADMSEFSKYMEEHDLTNAFNDFFGLCNDNISSTK